MHFPDQRAPRNPFGLGSGGPMKIRLITIFAIALLAITAFLAGAIEQAKSVLAV